MAKKARSSSRQQDGYVIQHFVQPRELHERKATQRRVITNKGIAKMQDPQTPSHRRQKASTSKSARSQYQKESTTTPPLDKDITREPQWIWMLKAKVKKL